MRYLTMAGAVLLAALVGQAEATGDKKNEPAAPWAKAMLGGEIRDLLELRSKLNVLALLDRDMRKATGEYQWNGPPPQRTATPPAEVAHVRSVQVGDAAWVVVLLDET